MLIVDSCMIWFHFDCIMQLKKSCHIATNVCSRKSATTFSDLPDCLCDQNCVRRDFNVSKLIQKISSVFNIFWVCVWQWFYEMIYDLLNVIRITLTGTHHRILSEETIYPTFINCGQRVQYACKEYVQFSHVPLCIMTTSRTGLNSLATKMVPSVSFSREMSRMRRAPCNLLIKLLKQHYFFTYHHIMKDKGHLLFL